MFWLLLVAFVAIVVAMFFVPRDRYGMAPDWTIGVGTLAVLMVAAMGVWRTALHYDRATCHSWAQQTGRDTRFAYYNVFAWECLTQAHDGKWVPKDQIGDYNK